MRVSKEPREPRDLDLPREPRNQDKETQGKESLSTAGMSQEERKRVAPATARLAAPEPTTGLGNTKTNQDKENQGKESLSTAWISKEERKCAAPATAQLAAPEPTTSQAIPLGSQ